MCNAWNHSLSCTCGWGGEGHLGRSISEHTARELSSYADWIQEIYQTEAKAFTNPNASCPVCGSAVYFYQSPDGGRVFFDELGPPWPKHPCTDNSGTKPGNQTPKLQLIDKNKPENKFDSNNFKKYAWQQDEWIPFICKNIVTLPTKGKCIAISGYTNGGSKTLYIHEIGLITRAPFHIRQRDESTYQISTAQFQSGFIKIFKILAYRHLIDAVTALKVTAKIAQTAHPPKRPSAAPQEIALQRTLPRHLQRPPNKPIKANTEEPETVMKQAFLNAVLNRKNSKA